MGFGPGFIARAQTLFIIFFMVVVYGPGSIENPIIKMVLRSYFSL